MKKISRAIVRFIKIILKFFDKWLITPITKFFVNFLEFFSSKGTKFEKYLVNRQALIIISLLFAVVTFYAIDKKHISLVDNSAEILYNQKVNVNYNEEKYIVEGVPKEVDVILVGRKMDVYLAKQYPVDGVTLDLTGYTPGSYSVGFKYEQAVTSVNYKVDPSSVNIRIYDKVSVPKEVTADIIHKDNLDSKLNIEEVTLDLDGDGVAVKGAQHTLDNVAVVKAIIDVDKISNVKVGTTTLSDIPLVAYNSEGEKIDVEIVPATVTASIKITSPSKEVPIDLQVEGQLSGVAIESLTPSVKTVVVYGSEESIKSIESLPVKIDVKGVSENKTYSINLKKPAGIREISEKTITVELKVGDIVAKDVPAIPIDAINLASGYSVQVIGEKNVAVTVIVSGTKTTVENVDASKIKAYVDLSGLEEGEHTVPVHVKGDDSTLSYVPRVKEITVRISQ